MCVHIQYVSTYVHAYCTYVSLYDHVTSTGKYRSSFVFPGLSDRTGLLEEIFDMSNRKMVRMRRTVTREGRQTMGTQHSSSSSLSTHSAVV